MTKDEEITTSPTALFRFGVGCFHFSYVRSGPYSATVADYVKAVTAALERVGAINNVEVESFEPEEKFSVSSKFDVPKLADSYEYFPSPTFFSAEFDVFIPVRIQEELVEGSSADTRTENFRVFIGMTFHGPVAFVQLLSPDETDMPRGSTGVQVVREYLQQQIQQSEISFDYLGPSPFHADFTLSLQALKTLPTRFVIERHVQVGYDEILVRANSTLFGYLEEAFQEFRHEVEDEIGFFYDVVRRGRVQFRSWMSIVDQLDELAKPQARRLSVWFNRRFGLARRLKYLMTEVVRFEADVVIEKTMIERDYRSVYGPTSLNVVRSDVDEELKQLPEFATKPVLKLITFFEKRRVLKIGWLVVIIAAIIGGISGAAISHLPATSRFFRSTKGIQTSQENTKIASPSLPSPSRSSLGPSEPSIANPTPVLRLELPRPQTSPTPGP